MPDFIGRNKELKQLEALLDKGSASLIVVKGRRRIGKSRLIQEFGKNMRMLSFSGLPPTNKTTADEQRREFGWQLGQALNQPAFKEENWNDLFIRLAQHTQKGRVLIFLDEISWMGSKDRQFLGKLKNIWDLELKKNPKLILVLCGSVSRWIEKNILSYTGFVGRISLTLTIEELPLSDCNVFWGKKTNEIASYEKFKMLSVMGGIPKYLEEMQPNLPAEINIQQLFFNRSGFLFNEFEQIFTDIFSRRSEIYRRILMIIADGNYEAKSIFEKLSIEKTGTLSAYLDDLVKAGFLKRDFNWHFKTGKTAKLSRYRISDNYIRFYLKYVAPLKDRIIQHGSIEQPWFNLPGWESIMGLQFENLVLNNRTRLFELLGIKPVDVVYDNPFFQTKTARQEGCQVDYLIQTRLDTMYVCEIKFSRYPIRGNIIQEMQEKIRRLNVSHHVSRRAVLIHVNGVADEVLDAHYFSNIIDFRFFLS